ncbi:hypothetical protein ACSDQ9_06725 [Aestuariimicrobium soli]|uniref:hypothetical protein n=1 Tax=Aestuariimicrobium soli TaxID=2035834 RepID=UPI003EB7DC9E
MNEDPTMRRTLAASATALLMLAACGAPDSLAIGQTATYEVADDRSGTDAKLDVAVIGVKEVTKSALGDVQLKEDYASLYLVTYTAKVTSGKYAADYTYPFSAYKWSGDASKGKVTTINVVMGGIDGCPGFSSETTAKLAKGEQITACQVLATDEKGALTDVSLDSSRKGARTQGLWWSAQA